ncbi:HAD-IIIC family phosphatase [Nocardia paucivorans]|uniref:HAD-IIIC family phosphatase n=1 Tax=Nocardia paucivorans TaxID=114259 RepID=UPI000594D759|nr:HAD-IIIC family phosphatase [Nocardia paucivorans]
MTAQSTTVKCLVWDLDDTVWPGVVLESDGGAPKPEVLRTLRALDERGILHAVASRGERSAAVEHLRRHGIEDMFSAVEVGWGPKSDALRRIAESLNIGRDTLAFVDNDPVELAEVTAAYPEIRCYSVDRIPDLADLPEFTPETTTPEARHRRSYYRAEQARRECEAEFTGSNAEFLASLNLVMTVREASEEDLARAHELTVRTHQLNTTGITFDADELRKLCASPDHEVLVASLSDRFGGYGTIGLAVSEIRGGDSVLLLLLMSCRVMSRGAGTSLIREVVRRARAAGRRPTAEFVSTPLNRVMLVTLRFAGFEVIESDGERILLACNVPPERIGGTGHIEVIS